MTKAVQAFLAGVFFTFILDFFLFLGVKLHYIDAYNIDVYYNVLFADHQNLFLYLLFTAVLGYLVIYFDKLKITALVLAGLFGLVLIGTLLPSVGKMAGEIILMQKDQRVHDGRHPYRGDIYYNGRDDIYIFDEELQRLIRFSKQELINPPER